MCTLYDRIVSLCESRGIKPGRLCAELGYSRSTLADLKAGRTKSLTSSKLSEIAAYFGVSTDFLMGTAELCPDGSSTDGSGFGGGFAAGAGFGDGSGYGGPIRRGTAPRPITDDEIKFALFGTREIDDDVLDRVKQFAKFAQENEHK